MPRETVLVTGSSRGIGRAIAEKYAQNGHTVILNCARGEAEMGEALSRCAQTNRNVAGFCADVSDYAQVCALRRHIAERFGDVTVLVNNAGVSHIGLFTDMAPAQWQRVIDVNLSAIFNTCHVFAPAMIREKRGIITNISSIWGSSGASCESVYAAAKGAVNAFTKSLAKELAPSHIRVNAIACGVIDTRMNDCFSPDERRALTERIPAGRFGTAAEIAGFACFLSSPEAAYINGQVIAVDGGYS